MENKFEPLFYRTRGRETTSFVGVIEKDGKKIKIDFGYKLNNDKKPDRVFLFIETDFNLTASDVAFIKNSNLLIGRKEFVDQYTFFESVLTKGFDDIEIWKAPN